MFVPWAQFIFKPATPGVVNIIATIAAPACQLDRKLGVTKKFARVLNMKRNNKSNKKIRFVPIYRYKAICIALLVGSGVLFQLDADAKIHAASKLSLSLSIGLPHKGSLEKGEVLPKKGTGYTLLHTAKQRKARFGVSELIMLIKHATFKVQQRHGGAKLSIGDLSKRTGGRFEHHASHQNGRDVDFGFYTLNRKGQSVFANKLISFDKNGYSIEPAMTFKFDTKRNWALIVRLIDSPHAHVQWIFVANHLKTLLLEYGKKVGTSKRTLSKAAQMLKQPSKSSHFDHFHVRIYCPSNDKPKCKDFGPRWSWHR